MAGFKDFVNGAVVDEIDMDDYLMRQTAMRFATQAARASQLDPFAVPGMITYTEDDGLLWMRRGTQWHEMSRTIRKPADQQVTNSATITADTALTFNAIANGRYAVDMNLLVDNTGNASGADIKVGWAVLPASTTVSFGGSGPDPAATSSTAGVMIGSGNWAGVIGSVGSVLSYAVPNVGAVRISLSGTVNVGATAGAVTLGWAQNTATAAVATTLRGGSWMRVERFA